MPVLLRPGQLDPVVSRRSIGASEGHATQLRTAVDRRAPATSWSTRSRSAHGGPPQDLGRNGPTIDGRTLWESVASRRSRRRRSTFVSLTGVSKVGACRHCNPRNSRHILPFWELVLHICDSRLRVTRPGDARVSASRLSAYPLSPMPIAFKEWAVTVRALAEGEQLLTLRKGGIREPDQALRARARPLLPVPDLRPPAQRPRARIAPARAAPRARGGRVAGRRAARARATRDGGIRSPTASASAPGPRSPATTRSPTGARRRAVAVLRLDDRLRREAAGLEAPPPAARRAAAHVPHPAPGDRQGPRRLRRLPLVAGDRARPAVRGHPGALRRRVRPRLARRSRRSPPTPCPSRSELRRPRRPRSPDAERALCVGVGGGGDVVGALAVAELVASAAAPPCARRRR